MTEEKRYCAHCDKELRTDEYNIAESDGSRVCDECHAEDEEIENLFFS